MDFGAKKKYMFYKFFSNVIQTLSHPLKTKRQNKWCIFKATVGMFDNVLFDNYLDFV